MKENSIRRAVREGRAALGTGLKEFASRGVRHGKRSLSGGADVSTYLDGMKARGGRAHAGLTLIGVPTP